MMRKILFAILFWAVTLPGIACTTFCFDGIFGRNYDFVTGNGMVFVNKKGIEKVSMSPQPARWTSKYGSITFNQFGREFPTGGMNEAGLVVELMWLEDTHYPEKDQRPELGGLEWIQYQLDNFSSVDEVAASVNDARILSVAPLHFLIADKNGKAASVEFLDGKAVIHAGNALPVPVLTNDTYEKSLRFVKNGGKHGNNSLERFSIASKMVDSRANNANPVDYAFSILDRVSQDSTKWSIVYDMKQKHVSFRTSKNRQIRSFAFSSFDFSCGSQVKVLDMNQPGSGDVAQAFVPYTSEANRKLISESSAKVPFLADTNPEAVAQSVSHAEQMKCAINLSAQ